MKRNVVSLMLLTLMVALMPLSASAAEALPELAGKWVAESMDGKAPPPGAKMTMDFKDDKTLRIEASYKGETQFETLKYSATKDGKITIFFEPDKKPEGDKATWSIKDKKLHLKTEDGETLILKRAA